MKIREISTPDPGSITPDRTLMDAARCMKDLDVGMLPVCEYGRLVGSITDRDIVVRGVAAGRNAAIATVREMMTPEIAYCYDDESIFEAAEIMERRRVRRLAVLDRDRRLVGVVSLSDLAVRAGKERLTGQILEHVCEPLPPAA